MNWQEVVFFSVLVISIAGGWISYIRRSSVEVTRTRFSKDQNVAWDDRQKRAAAAAATVDAKSWPWKAPTKCPVETCRIKTPHSHAEDLARRIKGQ